MTNPLYGKRIILGVTGSIAAYKATDLASKLTQSGALVDVILTDSACQFITPLSFQSVTGRKAFTDQDLWGGEGHVTHIHLGKSADLMILAPASANTMAKLAFGIADNLLTVTVLAGKCPVIIAPAMDGGMYENAATQANVRQLVDRDFILVGPAEGHLASGLSGIGRMVEPVDIAGTARYILAKTGPLAGKKIVVTAGGTREPIDPVRFISNRSSGKQGFALAQVSIDYGADTTLISAAVTVPAPVGCKYLPVNTAEEMYQSVIEQITDCDVLIMAAAVADYRPNKSDQKIKKASTGLMIDLQPTKDILKAISQHRKSHPYPRFVIGFAAESENLLENARKKLLDKNLDMIVANDISSDHSGFEVANNQVTLIQSSGKTESHPLLSKSDVADLIFKKIAYWF